jgi:hypothetical protein
MMHRGVEEGKIAEGEGESVIALYDGSKHVIKQGPPVDRSPVRIDVNVWNRE